MVLSHLNEIIINSLSRSDVEKTLTGLKRFTKKGRWLSKNNRYAGNTVRKIESELNAGGIQNPRHLSQYIAASSLLHCSDGWSYLGKAISSLLRGDPHRSRHLAYYAELRATMSLLATVGIGVFNRQHLVINAAESVSPLRGIIGTHVIAWECLTSWAQQSSSSDLFASIVKPNGRSLEDWLAPLGGGNVVAPQAKEWFRQWGIDLMVFSEDRNARNESSYRPDGVPDTWSIDPSQTIQFTKDIWATLEPSSTPFENVDRHILRLSLESIFKSQSGRSAIDDRPGFLDFAKSIVEYQNMSLSLEKNWLQFITRKISKNDPSFFTFSKEPPNSIEKSVFAIISRAVLLLRIASGSSSQLFQDAGYDAESLAFWWQGVVQDRGLSDDVLQSDELTDLWQDVAECLEDISHFQATYQTNMQTFSRFGYEYGKALVGLGSFERVAIWGMAPA